MTNKRLLAIVMVPLCLLVMSLPMGCRKAAKNTTEKVVSGGKEVIGGISEGIEKGRKGSGGADNAIIISTSDELAKHADVTVFQVISPKDAERSTRIELAVVNRENQPVELTGLHKIGCCAVIDDDEFFTPLDEPNSPSSFEVLPNAKQKLVLYFTTTNEKLAYVLLYGKKYSLKGLRVGEATLPASQPATKPD